MAPVSAPGFVWEPCTIPAQECPTPPGVDPDVWARVRAVAAFRLWEATGARFGQCPHSADVCSASHLVCGRNLTGSMQGCSCRHDHRYSVALPPDATTVDEVTDPSTGNPIVGWRVDWNTKRLVSADPFPELVEIDYLTGRPWPIDAANAIDEYAAQLAKTWCNTAGTECALPAGVKVVSRDGVEYMIEASESRQRIKGATGIAAVDDWLRSAGTGYRPRIWTQDTPTSEVMVTQ